MSDYPERISISPVYRHKHDDDFYLVDRKAFPGKGTEYVRADRIEELEADLQDAHRVGAEWFEQSKQNHKRATTAEAKLEKAVEALEKLNVGEGWAAQIARTTLAELKGESHE